MKWLPRSYPVFSAGFERGYVVSRAEVVSDGKTERLGQFVKLTEQPIKYWSKDRFMAEVQRDSSVRIAGLFLSSVDSIVHPSVATNAQAAVAKADAQRLQLLIGAFSAVVSNKVAEAYGLYFEDKSCNPMAKYVYKIEIPGYDKYVTQILVMPAAGQEREKVMGLVVNVDPGVVHLSWFNNKNRHFPYYNIYRSQSKTKGFIKLNAVPYMGNSGDGVSTPDRTTFVDSIKQYNTLFYYKVVGVNAFGEEGIYSDVKEVRTVYRLVSGPRVTNTESFDNKTIKLQWEMSADDAPYVTGFTVFRSFNGREAFVKVNKGMLSAKQTQFTDITPYQSANFYTVCAYGQGGDSVCSMLKSHFLVDSIPPAKPEMISGTCDTNGIVIVRWKRGTETDLNGYRVFRTYLTEKEPVRMTERHITDTMFVDTISLKEPYNKIYYRVAAIDGHVNASVPSEYVEVVIPDILPPTNGYIRSYEVTVSGIKLVWQNSNAYDLKYMYLMRKSRYDFDFQPILRLSSDSLNISEYTDTATQSKQSYEYAVLAEDQSGLKSELSPVVNLTQMNKEKIESVQKLEAIVSHDNQTIKLSWEYPQSAIGFRLYRAANGGQLETYTFVTGDQREFYDKWVRPNTKYTYLMVAELEGGFKSGYSSKLDVKY